MSEAFEMGVQAGLILLGMFGSIALALGVLYGLLVAGIWIYDRATR